jgi:predicted ATP-dependent serine protease
MRAGVSRALYGRDGDVAAITAVLDGARAGRGGALVIRGEAGMGKTALLDLAERCAADMTVLRATAIETEAELPFAGLHLQLARWNVSSAWSPGRSSHRTTPSSLAWL